MERSFREGETIFCDYREPYQHRFGVVLREEEEIYDDEIMLVSFNHSGETEMRSDAIYKIAENRVCTRCGGVVCIDHCVCLDAMPYYCPSCEEGMFEFETQEVHMNQFAEALRATERRFVGNAER